MAQNASLSAGRNNGDRTWSVTTDEIEDLTYCHAYGPLIPHTLQVRVIAVTDDQATTLMMLETDIGTDALATPLRLFTERENSPAPTETAATTAGDSGDDFETTAGLSKAITQSRQHARARIAAAKAASEADEASRSAGVPSAELATLHGRVQELEAQLAEREQALASTLAAREDEQRTAKAELQARVDEARDAAERSAREAATKNAGKRGQEAAATWEREKELLLAEAKVQLETAIENSKPEKVRAKAEAAFDKERKKLEAEAERRVADALKAARKEADQAQKAAHAEWQAERKTLTAEAKAQAAEAAEAARHEATEQAVAKAKTEATKAAGKAAEVLETARNEWQAETKRQLDAAAKSAAEQLDANAKTTAEQLDAAAKSAAEQLDAAAKSTAEQLDAAKKSAAEQLAAANAKLEGERAALIEAHERQLSEAVDAARTGATTEAEQALAAERGAWQAEKQALEARVAGAAETEQKHAAIAAERDTLQADIKRIRSSTADEIERAHASHDIELATLRAELLERIEGARREGETAGRSAATQAMTDDADGVLSAARAAWEDELSATVERVRADAAAEAKTAQASTLGTAVEAARAEWKAERQQIEAAAQERLDEAQREAEAAQRALREQEAAWETEKHQLLADADARIAEAGADGADNASAEASRRDAAVKAASADLERRWQRDFDTQADAAEKRIAAIRVNAETELEAERARAVRSALADARTRWEAEFDTRLAQAHGEWQAEEEKRLSAAQAQLEGDFSRRLELVEARLDKPAATSAATAAAGGAPAATKPAAADDKLAHTIAQWNRSHRRRRKLPLPHIPRRLALVTICGALVIGGAIYYQKGIELWQRYAPVVDAEVGPHASEVTAQARQIAALVEAAIRERFPAAPVPVDDIAAADGSAVADSLGQIWVKPVIANMRAEPSAEGALVTTLARGVEVDRLGNRGVWIHVRTRQGVVREGWMHASVLTSKGPKAAAQ